MYVVGQGHPMCEIFGEINVIPETSGRASPGVEGWDLLNQLPPDAIFPMFHHFQNTCYLLDIMFIFHRCHHSWAVTPIKYESDSKNLKLFLQNKKKIP